MIFNSYGNKTNQYQCNSCVCMNPVDDENGDDDPDDDITLECPSPLDTPFHRFIDACDTACEFLGIDDIEMTKLGWLQRREELSTHIGGEGDMLTSVHEERRCGKYEWMKEERCTWLSSCVLLLTPSDDDRKESEITQQQYSAFNFSSPHLSCSYPFSCSYLLLTHAANHTTHSQVVGFAKFLWSDFAISVCCFASPIAPASFPASHHSIDSRILAHTDSSIQLNFRSARSPISSARSRHRVTIHRVEVCSAHIVFVVLTCSFFDQQHISSTSINISICTISILASSIE